MTYRPWIRTPRNSYATKRNPAGARAKAESRCWIIEQVRASGSEVNRCLLLPSIRGADMIVFRRYLKPKSWLLIDRDPDVHDLMCVNPKDHHERFVGNVRQLFDPSSWSWNKFKSRYGHDPLTAETNLIWLDFCSSIAEFTPEDRADWLAHMKRNPGFLFITHSILPEKKVRGEVVRPAQTIEQVLEEYARSFPGVQCTHLVYKTASTMCVIGLRF